MKQQVLNFPNTHYLTSITALTNGGFFTNEFGLSHLIDLAHISYHGHHVLSKGDDATN